MTQGANEIVIDYRDDKTLRNLMPGAFGPYGFDSHRANLLVRGMVMHPSLKEALAKRVEEELTDRAAARFAKSLDRFNPVLFKQSQKANPTPTPQSDNSGQSDGESWTDEKTEALVRLHAQRVPFKDIAVSITPIMISDEMSRIAREKRIREKQEKKSHSNISCRHRLRASKSRAARSTFTGL